MFRKGLLRDENLLMIAPTGTGKTLVGELAGLRKLFNGDKGKMLYLGNLVALVNQKYELFKRRYGKQFNVAIRVGMSKLDVGEEDIIIVEDGKGFVAKFPSKKFLCPMCGGISTDPNTCNSGDEMAPGKVCDWKSWGLFGTMGKGVYVCVKKPFAVFEIFKPVELVNGLTKGSEA